MNKDYELYIKPYREHNDDPNKWQGESWGKWFTSAALAFSYQPTPEHRKIIDDAASALVKIQESNDRLSSYSKNFGDWDIWGRK